MGRQASRVCRIPGRHRRRRILVCATCLLPRRPFMKRVMVLSVLVVVGGLSLAATGFQGPPAGGGQGRGRGPQGPPVAQIEKVKDNLYEITGGGGNTAAFITDKGVVVVDTKLAGWGQAILDKIKTVTDKPVIEIINTHTHG